MSALILYGYPRDPAKLVFPAEMPEPARAANTREAAASDFISPQVTPKKVVDAYVAAALAADPVRVDWRNQQAEFQALANGAQQVRLLHGQTNVVFSMYGAPGELDKLRQLVGVMRAQKLGNGFDPVLAPQPNAKPVFDYLATVGWPAICYSGGEMQIKGGRAVLGRENELSLAAMDRAGGGNGGG